MKASGGGSVVNIAASGAFGNVHSVYGLAKAGVVHLTRQFALELAPEVRVNCLAPGLIADYEGMDPAKAAEVVEGAPLGSLVSRAEIAEALYLLCGPAFASVTGQTIIMDGGHSMT
jgi:NAD(P)-dependent dehydrogenase (short-subunit alcohol dehydrogenase family)